MNTNCGNCNVLLSLERRDMGFRLCLKCAEQFARENRNFLERNPNIDGVIKAALQREKEAAEAAKVQKIKDRNVKKFFDDFAKLRKSNTDQ